MARLNTWWKVVCLMDYWGRSWTWTFMPNFPSSCHNMHACMHTRTQCLAHLSGPLGISSTVNLNCATNSPDSKLNKHTQIKFFFSSLQTKTQHAYLLRQTDTHLPCHITHQKGPLVYEWHTPLPPSLPCLPPQMLYTTTWLTSWWCHGNTDLSVNGITSNFAATSL